MKSLIRNEQVYSTMPRTRFNAASCSLFFLLFILSNHAWSNSGTPSDYNIKYWSFIDYQNRNLDELLSVPNEQWTPFNGKTRESFIASDDFWRGNEHPIVWVKIKLPRHIVFHDLWLEIVPNVGIDGLIVEKLDDKWTWEEPEGRRIDDSTNIPVNHLTFKIDAQNEYKYAYLKLNTSQVFHFSVNEYNYSGFSWYLVKSHLFNAFILGALALAICYNLVIGISAGERVYLIYSSYVLCIFLFSAVIMGYGRVLFPDWGGDGVNIRTFGFLLCFTVISFVREFFDSKNFMPTVDNVMQYTRVGIVVLAIVSLFINDFYAFLISDFAALFVPILVTFTISKAMKMGHPLAKYLLLAWSFIIISSIYWALVWIGLIEPTLLPTRLVLLGSLVEVVLISLVLGYRYSFLKAQTEQLTNAQNRFIELSETDELTGILNRRGFLKAANSAMLEGKKNSAWLSLDIDHFKQFNDVNGHLAGDKLLAEFGGLLAKRTQREDLAAKLMTEDARKHYRKAFIGRIGGEEFAILLINSNLAQTKLYAERLLREFEDITVKDKAGGVASSTLSIGGAIFTDDITLENAWQRADKNLSKAKSEGRNQCNIA
jgi:diguanylate cyclase (GGDEF)-like protein